MNISQSCLKDETGSSTALYCGFALLASLFLWGFISLQEYIYNTKEARAGRGPWAQQAEITEEDAGVFGQKRYYTYELD